MRRWWFANLMVGFVLGLAGPVASALPRLSVDRPGDREFVRDDAGLLSDADAKEVAQRCDQLLTDTGTPIFVVTVQRMADYGGQGLTIGQFARTLFDDWGDTHPLIHGQDWREGFLFVVAVDDRQARIELGPARATAEQAQVRHIMESRVLPTFRRGDYAQGIMLGVASLDATLRRQPLPAPPVDVRAVLFWCVLVTLGMFAVVSLFRPAVARGMGRLASMVLAFLPGVMGGWAARPTAADRPDEVAAGATAGW